MIAFGAIAPVRFEGKPRGKSPDYESLGAADTARLLHAWMYTDLSGPRNRLPKYTRHIDEPRWINLYDAMLTRVLAELDPEKTPNAHAFFSRLHEPVAAMKAGIENDPKFRFQVSGRYDSLRRRAIDNLEKLDKLEQILLLSDKKLRTAALEETVTREFVNKRKLWFLA